MSKSKKTVIITILVVLAILIVVFRRARDKKEPEVTTLVASKPTATPTAAPSATPIPKARNEMDQLIDAKMNQFTKPPDLGPMKTAWVKDSQGEADEVGRESYAESLKNICDYKKNFSYQVLGGEEMFCNSHTQSGFLRRIVLTRRFAKLYEQLRENPEHRNIIIAQLNGDIGKLGAMKDSAGDNPDFSVGALYDPSLDDQSDLPTALTSRIITAELLVGQLAIAEALPTVLQSYELRKETFLLNPYATAYACDKILSTDHSENPDSEKRKIHDEYMAWRERYVGEHASGYNFFNYETRGMPSYRSATRPNERATSLMAPVDYSQGKMTVELPRLVAEGITEPIHRPKLPIKEIVEFAQRYCKN